MLCYPRAEEEGKLYIERQQQWTNGFFPGILWMLVQSDSHAAALSETAKARFLQEAKRYTAALEPEARRDVTHDLGFILYNSYGQGLVTDDPIDTLDSETKTKYADTIDIARNTLATRYSAAYGVIESWDWEPDLPVYYLDDDGEQTSRRLDVRSPWQYPVIVDNMMNLEMMLTSADPAHRALAYDHAANKARNHYEILRPPRWISQPIHVLFSQH